MVPWLVGCPEEYSTDVLKNTVLVIVCCPEKYSILISVLSWRVWYQAVLKNIVLWFVCCPEKVPWLVGCPEQYGILAGCPHRLSRTYFRWLSLLSVQSRWGKEVLTILNSILDQPVVRLENWIKSLKKWHVRRQVLCTEGFKCNNEAMRCNFTGLFLLKPLLRQAGLLAGLIIVEATLGDTVGGHAQLQGRQQERQGFGGCERRGIKREDQARVNGSIGACRACISRHIRLTGGGELRR